MSSSQQPAAASPAAAEPAAAKRRFDMTMWNSTVTRIFLCVDVVLIVLVVAEALVMRNCSKELHGYRKALGIDEHGEEDGEEHDEHAVGRDPGAPHHTAHDDMIEMYPAWFTYVFPWVPVLLALLCMALYAIYRHRRRAQPARRPDGFEKHVDVDEGAGGAGGRSSAAEAGTSATEGGAPPPPRASWLCCGGGRAAREDALRRDQQDAAHAEGAPPEPGRQGSRSAHRTRKQYRQERPEAERPPMLLVSMCVVLVVMFPLLGISSQKQCVLAREAHDQLPDGHQHH